MEKGAADNSDSEGVSGVVGLWKGVEFEEALYHFLHLFFIGLAVTSCPLLYLIWRRLNQLLVGIGDGKQNDTSRHAYINGGFGIGLKKEFLDRNCIRFVFFDKPCDIVAHLF